MKNYRRLGVIMKIGIVGNYGKANHGDEAILEGMLVQLEEAFNLERKDILVFSANPIQTHKKFGVQSQRIIERRKTLPMKFLATLMHHKPVIEKLDLLLIGGGGILMDLYKAMPVRYSIYAWLAKIAKTPAVVYGTGAGPISTPMGKRLIKFIVDSTELTMVRDPKSEQLLHSIGVRTPVSVITDPAFFIPPPEKVVRNDGEFHIGVTTVAYYDKHYWPTEDKEKYENYVNGMAMNLDTILEGNPNAVINFFSTKHPYDTDVSVDIKERMKYRERCTVALEEMNHMEIIEFANKQDLVIGTRLHSLILSLVTETPIIAVAYHHKVQDFMDSVDCSNYVLPIEELHLRTDYFDVLVKEMNKDWERTLKEFSALSQKIKNKERKGMDLIKQLNLPTK